MKNFAIVLSGCGVQDGAEIHEATMAMLAISRKGHHYRIFAPNILQQQVINHLSGEKMPETRNVLVEAARIARGDAKDLADFSASAYDVLLFAGGFGVAKNLSDFASKGAGYTVIPEVAKAIREMHSAGKPIGAICVAPILIADVIKGVELTFGRICDASQAAEQHGAIHRVTTHGEVITDKRHKVATTPGYMLNANIAQVAEGAENIVSELLEMM